MDEILKNPEKHLRDNYGNTDSPVSFLSSGKIYRFYNRQLSMKKIKEFLTTSESYTLLKPEKSRRIFNTTITYEPRDLVQADLF